MSESFTPIVDNHPSFHADARAHGRCSGGVSTPSFVRSPQYETAVCKLVQERHLAIATALNVGCGYCGGGGSVSN